MITLRNGSKGDLVKRLQQGLAHMGFRPGVADGIFGDRTESATEAFQTKQKLYADGIAGEQTWSAFNSELKKLAGGAALCVPFLAEPADPPSQPEGIKLKWVKCPADKFEDRSGYTSTRLRSDTAEAYQDLYDETHRLGGIISSAGGRRSLTSKASPNRSRKSMHYVGRAFDMALPTGLKDPDVDPFVIVRDGDTRYWTVWCRTNPAIDQGELTYLCKEAGIAPPATTLEGTYLKGKKVLTKETTGLFFNFTALAAKHGFERIPARRNFFTKGTYGAAEWWHHQYIRGLVKGENTFGEELLKVYSLKECQAFLYWDQVKNCRWGVNWWG